MTPKLKQTRARSEEKKADQFERILEAGQQLFLKKGTQGFSMRKLAEMLDMTKNNLYNYIESKRELWIAIRNKFYNQYREENLEIINNHEGSTCDLILKLYEHFLDFSDRDYDKFRMMYNIIDAPHSDKIGPIEKTYKEFRLLDGTTKLIQKAIDDGEISSNNAALLSLYSYSLVMGVAYIEMNRNAKYVGGLQVIWETTQLNKLNISKKEFKEYSMKALEVALKRCFSSEEFVDFLSYAQAKK